MHQECILWEPNWKRLGKLCPSPWEAVGVRATCPQPRPSPDAGPGMLAAQPGEGPARQGKPGDVPTQGLFLRPCYLWTDSDKGRTGRGNGL